MYHFPFQVIEPVLKLSDGNIFTVIGTYMPCGSGSSSDFNEELNVIEAIICAQDKKGPVMITGDFNAHLGPLGGPQAVLTSKV